MTTDYDNDRLSQAVEFHLRGEAVIVIVTSHCKQDN